jgi:prepilin-type processing-associated H-X9-DG protein
MDKVFKINATATALFWIMVIGIFVFYIIKQKNKNTESNYLFLDGSYFINEPYADSYPQY